MALRFSEDGPEFPNTLVDSLLLGEVVFICGAGVSTPQLPGFRGLLNRVYDLVDVDVEGAERLSINAERYEEALGTLARRLANPQAVYDAVANVLKVPVLPKLEN